MIAVGLAVAGAAISAVLWHRTAGATTACGLGGCDLVQASAYARPLGVPLPAWGTAAFLFVTAMLLGGGRRSDRAAAALRLALGLGAIAGTALLCIQAFVVRAWCPLCITVDAIAIALGALAASSSLAAPRGPGAATGRRMAIAIGALPALAMLVFLPTAASPPATLPEPASAGESVRIVEFVDVQCPFCRDQHARLAVVLGQLPEIAVDLVVRHVPIPSHPQAEHAAAVACCGEAQGRGTEMLDALMRADDLSAAGCRRHAADIGLDLPALDACLDSSVVADRLRRDRQAARTLGVRALPTCVIGGRALTGLQSAETLREAILGAAEPTDAAGCESSAETI